MLIIEVEAIEMKQFNLYIEDCCKQDDQLEDPEDNEEKWNHKNKRSIL